MLCSLILLLFNSIHTLPKIVKHSIESEAFSIFKRLQKNTNGNVFHGSGNLITWLWKSLEIHLEKLVRTLVFDNTLFHQKIKWS